MLRSLSLAVVASLLAAGSAGAARLSSTDLMAVRAACQTELTTLCKDAPRGQGRLMQCMSEHGSQLSSGCRDALAGLKEKYTAASPLDVD